MAEKYQPKEKAEKVFRADLADETVILTSVENRTHEFQIAHLHFRFSPHETKIVPKWITAHADFENQKKRFLVKE